MYEFLEYQVGDVMTRHPVTISRETTLADIERIFEAHGFNALPVVSAGARLEGIVTKLDFLKAFTFTPQRIIPLYDEIMQRPAEGVMTSPPITVAPQEPLTRVLETMVATRYKSFPVIKGDRLVGIVAREDIARALRRAAGGRDAQNPGRRRLPFTIREKMPPPAPRF